MGKLVFYKNVFLLGIFVLVACIRENRHAEEFQQAELAPLEYSFEEEPSLIHVSSQDVAIKNYFNWIEALVGRYDSVIPFPLSEQILVHHNPQIIETFAQSDYYYQANKDTFQYDQKDWIVIKKGDTIKIPSGEVAAKLENWLDEIHIDINLPEYTLRLKHKNLELAQFPVRIGQPRTKYLPALEKEMDLHTVIGPGTIIAINKSPNFTNFTTGEVYEFTRRDDEKTTKMPMIPSLEPEINGVCYGQLIHATTNPTTLGKAYSHGCIGTKEGDAWRIYFHSRVGTPIKIRYDLKILNENGDTVLLPDVYGLIQ